MSLRIAMSSLDRLFSKYIHLRDKETCQRCGRTGNRMEAGHIFSRAKKSVRYDPDNCFLFCGGPNAASCHRWLDQHTDKKYAWAQRRLGEQRFQALQVREATPKKLDPVLVKATLTLLVQAEGGWMT